MGWFYLLIYATPLVVAVSAAAWVVVIVRGPGRMIATLGLLFQGLILLVWAAAFGPELGLATEDSVLATSAQWLRAPALILGAPLSVIADVAFAALWGLTGKRTVGQQSAISGMSR